MSSAKKKRPRARARPLPQAINVEVVDSRLKQWTPRLQFVAIFFAAGAALWGAYKWFGLPTLVVDSTLHGTIGEVKKELNQKIGETETRVIGHSNKNTEEVKVELSGAKKILDSLARKADRGEQTALEMQRRQIFLQRSQLQNSLSSVKTQLSERPNDSFLQQRQGELEAFMRNVEREAQEVDEQIRRARQGN